MGKGGNGGDGGWGGPAGSGSGATGGASFALVYKGTEPTSSGTTFTFGQGGAKGTGGTVQGIKAPDGSAGQAAEKYKVP
jgi:hypothetical protein